MNIQNKNNSELKDFDATSNPELNCIQVDDEEYAHKQTDWKTDTNSLYKENCAGL